MRVRAAFIALVLSSCAAPQGRDLNVHLRESFEHDVIKLDDGTKLPASCLEHAEGPFGARKMGCYVDRAFASQISTGGINTRSSSSATAPLRSVFRQRKRPDSSDQKIETN